jgi:hypothetical protein
LADACFTSGPQLSPRIEGKAEGAADEGREADGAVERLALVAELQPMISAHVTNSALAIAAWGGRRVMMGSG